MNIQQMDHGREHHGAAPFTDEWHAEGCSIKVEDHTAI